MADLNTILLVDDDPISIKLIRHLLDDYDIQVATDGKEGLKAYEKYKPFLIISDINMPNSTGLDFIKKVRQKDHNTKVIFLTSHSNVEYLLESSELKLTSYLLKPIQKAKLLEKIEQAKKEFQNYTTITNTLIEIDEHYSFSFDTMELYYNSKAVTLTYKESAILSMLIKKRNTPVGFDDIIYTVWDDSLGFADKQNLKTMMTGLRKKLPEGVIKNVYGVGYKIIVNS